MYITNQIQRKKGMIDGIFIAHHLIYEIEVYIVYVNSDV